MSETVNDSERHPIRDVSRLARSSHVVGAHRVFHIPHAQPAGCPETRFRAYDSNRRYSSFTRSTTFQTGHSSNREALGAPHFSVRWHQS